MLSMKHKHRALEEMQVQIQYTSVPKLFLNYVSSESNQYRIIYLFSVDYGLLRILLGCVFFLFYQQGLVFNSGTIKLLVWVKINTNKNIDLLHITLYFVLCMAWGRKGPNE